MEHEQSPQSQNQNQNEDDKLRELQSLPPEEKGYTRKKKMTMAALGVSGLLFLTMVFFFMGKQSPKQPAKVSAANRGLMQAEAIRQEKDLFGDKTQGRDAETFGSKPIEKESPLPSGKTETAEPSLFEPQGNPSDLGSVKPREETRDFGRTQSAKEPSSFGAASLSVMEKSPDFKPKDELSSRMSDEYQKAIAFYASEQVVFASESKEKNAAPQKEESTPKKPVTKVMVSAGEELTAVLNESLDSDYPSVAKATLTSPAELSGATILLSYSLSNERVTAQVQKLILPAKENEKAREMTIAAVVKSGLPGLSGDVNHHWVSQIASGIANAGLTAGALAYASQNSSKDLGTAVLVAPMVEQSVQGVLRPVNYLGRDRPITVTVPAGTEFTLLVTDGFEVDL